VGLRDERRAQMFPPPERCTDRPHGRAWEAPAQARPARFCSPKGDINRAFFVILSGSVEIRAGEQEVVVHGSGEFTGELDLLTGRPSLVHGRVITAGEVVEMDNDQLRRVVQADSDISDVLLRAFILRRMAIIQDELGTVVNRRIAPFRRYPAVEGIPLAKWRALLVDGCRNKRRRSTATGSLPGRCHRNSGGRLPRHPRLAKSEQR